MLSRGAIAALALVLSITSIGAGAEEGAPVFEATPAREREPRAPLLAPPGDPLVSERQVELRAATATPGDATYRPPVLETPPRAGANVAPEAAGVLYQQLQDLQQEVMMLRGVVEAQQNRIERLEREQRERYLDLDRRLATGGGAALGSVAEGGGRSMQRWPTCRSTNAAPMNKPSL